MASIISTVGLFKSLQGEFRLHCFFMSEMNVVEVQLHQMEKKKIKAMQVWSLSGETWSSRSSQQLIRYIFARKFAVNKILPVIYFANLEESSLPNSFWSKISLHVSRFHYPATMGLFCFSHARQPRKQNMCMLLAKAQEAILYICLERRFGKNSEGQTLTKSQTTLSVLGFIHIGTYTNGHLT